MAAIALISAFKNISPPDRLNQHVCQPDPCCVLTDQNANRPLRSAKGPVFVELLLLAILLHPRIERVGEAPRPSVDGVLKGAAGVRHGERIPADVDADALVRGRQRQPRSRACFSSSYLAFAGVSVSALMRFWAFWLPLAAALRYHFIASSIFFATPRPY